MSIVCNLCGRQFSKTVGLKTHLRWGTRCIPKESYQQEEEGYYEEPESDSQGVTTPEPHHTTLSVINGEENSSSINTNLNWESISPPLQESFYYTAIQDNKSEHSDDDFSIISDHEINGIIVPNEIFYGDENERPRQDGREQRYIDFVEGVMKTRPPPAPPSTQEVSLVKQLKDLCKSFT